MRHFATLIVATVFASAAMASSVGKSVEDFRLQDYRGAWHELSAIDDDALVVVAFVGTECPLAKLYSARLAKIASAYGEKGVAFLAIDPNRQDSITEIAHFAKKHQLDFPVLKDVGNKVADAFGALRTPEIFILDQDRVVRYHGRVDDQYGVGFIKPEASRADLEIALDELLAGKEVSVASTATPGCLIGRTRESSSNSDITYTKQISRILQQRCVECHREGQIAPFALTSYEDVAGWADMMLEVVEQRRMPPWHANPDHGDFLNDARMPEEEKELLAAWVEAGVPEGDPADLPEPIEFAEGWRIPEPDLVCEMQNEYDVPAEGEVPYQYFVLDPQLKEDKWVVAAECIAGNPSVVHHIIAFVVPPELAKDLPNGHFSTGRPRGVRGLRRDGGRDSGRKAPSERVAKIEEERRRSAERSGRSMDMKKRISIMRSWFTNYLVAMAPGTPPMVLRDGMAKLLPAGAKIVFQSHYTPNGSPQLDRSKIGLVFADPSEIEREVVTRNVIQQNFEIPPHHPNYEVSGTLRFREDTLMVDIFPHMHLRGKDFTYTLIYPDGKREVLLDVPNYDFGWQNIYELREPKFMPKGTVLECVAHFDNSEDNLSNPDPSSSVRFGDQTWEEMMIGFFNMARVRKGPYRNPDQTRTEQFLAMAKAGDITLTSQLAEKARAAVKSDEDFALLWDELAERLPQMDRLDISLADGLSFRFGRIEQGEEIPSTMKMKQLPGRLTAIGPALGLYQYAIKGETVVNDDPANVKGMEMQFLSRILPSSVHIPLRFEGKPATMNAWSSDSSAFPPEAVAFLEEIAEVMREAQARAEK